MVDGMWFATAVDAEDTQHFISENDMDGTGERCIAICRVECKEWDHFVNRWDVPADIKAWVDCADCKRIWKAEFVPMEDDPKFFAVHDHGAIPDKAKR